MVLAISLFSTYFVGLPHHFVVITFFAILQDGSYSRGPVEIPVGDYDQSKYYLSPTFKFEQVSSIAALILLMLLK